MLPHSVFATTLWGQYIEFSWFKTCLWESLCWVSSVAGPGAHCQSTRELPPFLKNSLADWAQSVLGWALTHVSIHSKQAVPGCLQLVPVWITARKGRMGNTRPARARSSSHGFGSSSTCVLSAQCSERGACFALCITNRESPWEWGEGSERTLVWDTKLKQNTFLSSWVGGGIHDHIKIKSKVAVKEKHRAAMCRVQSLKASQCAKISQGQKLPSQSSGSTSG